MLPLLLAVLLLAPSVSFGATRLGLHATAEEKAIWNARRTSTATIGGVSYKTMWDNRIINDANTFRAQAHPQGEGYWVGNTGGCLPKDQRYIILRGKGWTTQKSAFVFLVTGDNTYATGVAQELLNQINVPGTDWTNTGKWCLNPTLYIDTVILIDILPWLTRLLYAYDYLLAGGYTGFTPAQKTAINTWFVNAALYWENVVTNVIRRRFSAGRPIPGGGGFSGTEPTYTCNGVSCPGADIGPTHFGSTNIAKGFTIGWHNPTSLTAGFMGAVGILANHAGLKQRAGWFYKEFLRFSTWADGSIHDQSRWEDDPNTPHGVVAAWAHMYMQLQPMVSLADHFARNGDASLYTYQSPGGLYGTGGGNVDLLTVVRRIARLENRTQDAYASNNGTQTENTRLDSLAPTFAREYNHIGGAMANVYLKNAEVETSYSGVLGAQTGCGGFANCNAGAYGLFPDMLFMFGDGEARDPYTLGPAVTPDFTSNLTMHLPFDEGTGTTAQDSTVNNHDGTLGSGASWGAAKLGANAVVLDGTTNGIVTVTGKLGSPAAVTLAAWVKVAASPTPSAHVVSISDHVMFAISPTQIQGFYYNGTTWLQINAPATLGTTAWHHIAYTVAAGAQRLYLDGQQIAIGTQTAAISYAGLGTNTILGGHAFGGTTFRFQGSLDDVRVYSRALSAVDIGGLAAVVEPPPLAVQITTPVQSATYNATSSPLTLGGTASDGVGVTSITYTCPACSPAIATATPVLCTPACGAGVTSVNWTIPSIGLAIGASNVITVTASDGVGTQTDSLTVTYTPGVPDITSNLTMHLPFDEGTGTTAQDATVNNHDGTLGAGASWGAAQMGDSAVALNGTTTGIVTVTGELGTPADVTLAAWVKISAFPTPTQDIISIGDSVVLRTTATTVRGQYYTGTAWTSLENTVTLGTTAWHHLAFTVTANAQRLYIDGVNVATGSNGMAISYAGLGANTILGGHANGATTNFRFQGTLDDVRVYSRALTQGDIAALADLEEPPPLAIQITTPTPAASLAVAATPLTNLGGTSNSPTGVTGITYICPSCSPAITTPTAALCSPACGTGVLAPNWTIPSIGLAAGSQLITVTATDASGSATDTLTVTYTPPVVDGGGAACTHYAAQNGLTSNSGTSEGQPFRVVDFWGKGLATPGRVLCLLDGTYTGGNSLIKPPVGVNGTASQPITVRALHDGKVLIDSGGARAIDIQGNWWVLEGMNVTGSDNASVRIRGNDGVFRRMVAWLNGGNAPHIFDMSGNRNTLEDCAAFGSGEKVIAVGSSGSGSIGNVVRRCWMRAEDQLWSQPGGATNGFEQGYGQDSVTVENSLITWDITGASGAPTGILRSFRTQNSKLLGSIIYVLAGAATPSVSEMLSAYTDGGSPHQQCDNHPTMNTVYQELVSFVQPGNPRFGSLRPFTFLRANTQSGCGTSPAGSGNTVTNILGVGGSSPNVSSDSYTVTQSRHSSLNTTASAALAQALSGSGHSSIWTLMPRLCKRVVNGTTTTTGLWRWPMNQRILDAMSTAGRTPHNVTATIESLFGTIPTNCLSGSIEEETCTPPRVGTPPNCTCPVGTVEPNCDPETPPDTCPPDCPVQDVFFIATTGSPGPAGSDAAACTLEAPCATIQRARSLMTPGDTLYLRGGTYTGANNRIATSTGAFPAGNDWNTPTKIAAYGGETVVLQQSSGQLVTFSNLTTDRYVVMDRLTLDGATTGGNDTKCLVMSGGVHHIRFQNGTLRNCHFTALDISSSNSIEILDTTIHGTSHAQGAAVTGTSDSVLFDRVTFHSNAGHGLNASASGITNLAVKNSISRNNTGTGVRIGANSFLAFNLLAYGNAVGVNLTSIAVDGRLYNATVADNSGVEVQVDAGATDNQLTNVLAVGGITDNGTGTGQATNYTGDPGFVGGGNYYLAADTSPAADAGTCLPGVVDVALDTTLRPQPIGGECDIGAYEQVGFDAPPLPTPGALSARPWGSRLLIP